MLRTGAREATFVDWETEALLRLETGKQSGNTSVADAGAGNSGPRRALPGEWAAV